MKARATALLFAIATTATSALVSSGARPQGGAPNAAAALGTPQGGTPQAGPSPYPVVSGKAYKFEKITDGVYYATSTGSMVTGSNNVVIIGDRDLMVVDTGTSPAAARAFVEDVKLVTNKPVRYVVNTHFHYDHTDGNQVYAGKAEIIAHEYVKYAIENLNVLQREPFKTSQLTNVPIRIDDFKKQIAGEKDPARRVALEKQLVVAQQGWEELKEIKPTPPGTTYSTTKVLNLGGREVRLLFLGRGHTNGDTVVYLPGEKIVCTGDLMESQLAYMGDAQFDEWITTLEALKKLDFGTDLPGHGVPFQGKSLITAYQNYLRDLTTQVATLRKQGVPAEKAAQEVDLTSYAQYFPQIQGRGADLRGVRRMYAWMDEKAQSSTRTSEAAARQQCSALQGTVIPRDSIGLPTNAGVVVSASFISAADAGNTNGEFCKVLGSIHPVDPMAPDIKFEVNLPSNWNNKSLQLGGGGFDGSVVTGLGGVANQIASSPTPLAQGYVTLGSDSGHEGAGFDATFALNDEALANFGHLQIKKTHDAAMFLIKARYGSLPEHSYFAGGSQGGHEGFIAAQKYPADFDGVIAQYPAYNIALMHLGSNAFAKALYANHGAGWISPNKVKTLVAAVYAACDGLDGIADGIISNVAGCNKAFTMQTLQATLRCAGGADTGDSCLSDAQIGAVQAIASPFSLNFPTAGGLTTYPRWPILEGATFLNNPLGNTAVPSLPPAAGDAFQYKPADATIRYIITRNLTLDTLTFDPNQWAARIVEVSTILDANSVDVTQFMNKGGKLILMVGAIDDSITPHNTLDYYKRLVSRFGQAALDSFVRFYYIPGFGHGNGVFNAKFDSLSALDAWIVHGRAPGTLVSTDANPSSQGRTRPLCVYPAWPKYTGAGDVNAASSFTCVN